jgi:hypothetical protein
MDAAAWPRPGNVPKPQSPATQGPPEETARPRTTGRVVGLERRGYDCRSRSASTRSGSRARVAAEATDRQFVPRAPSYSVSIVATLSLGRIEANDDPLLEGPLDY